MASTTIRATPPFTTVLMNPYPSISALAGQSLPSRPATIERMIEVKVSFDTDLQRAYSDTRIWAALSLSAEDKAGIEDPREMERKAEGVADQAYRRWLVSNDPDEHLEQIRPYIELGFTHLVFHAPGDDQSRFLQLYAREILPRIRQRWG